MKSKQPHAACPDCPFRRVGGVRLHPERAEEIAETLRDDGHFHCHKTVDYSDDEPSTVGAALCMGSLVAQYNEQGHLGQMGRIAGRCGLIDEKKFEEQLDNPELVFDLDAFVEIHTMDWEDKHG